MGGSLAMWRRCRGELALFVVFTFNSLHEASTAPSSSFTKNWLYANVLGNTSSYDLNDYPDNSQVNVSLEVKYLHKIDTKNGVVDADLVMRMWWSDSRLVFPAAFKNKDGGLLVKRKDIWWPSDVSLINGRGNVPLEGSDIFVRIYPNGKAYMSRMLNSQI